MGKIAFGVIGKTNELNDSLVVCVCVSGYGCVAIWGFS